MERIIGVKIYDYEKNFTDLFAQWLDLGINTAFVGELLISRNNFRVLAEKNGVNLFIIMPIFHNPEMLEKHPDYYAITGQGQLAQQEWLNFICPSQYEYQQERIELIRDLIRKYQPSGISLDFIRHYIYWEKITFDSQLNPLNAGCFCTVCLNEFQRVKNRHLPETLNDIPQKADWILTNCCKEWAEWKCQLITKIVGDLATAAKTVKKDILINVHAVPWTKNDFGGAIMHVIGQDFVEISKYADYLSPMCYSHMLRRNPAWINSVVNDFHQHSQSKIIPSIQVKEYYRKETLSNNEFNKCLIEALKSPSQGVVFWEWDMLDHDSSKKLVLRTSL